MTDLFETGSKKGRGSIKGIDDLHMDGKETWAGKVRIEIQSDLGVNNFVMPFEKQRSVDDGTDCAVRRLGAFGKALAEDAALWLNQEILMSSDRR
jgi:hypothetical protein